MKLRVKSGDFSGLSERMKFGSAMSARIASDASRMDSDGSELEGGDGDKRESAHGQQQSRAHKSRLLEAKTGVSKSRLRHSGVLEICLDASLLVDKPRHYD